MIVKIYKIVFNDMKFNVVKHAQKQSLKFN